MGVYKLTYYSSLISEIPLRESRYLGNVRVVITDRKLVDLESTITGTNINEIVANQTFFTPEVVAYNDYYAFGMLKPERHGRAGDSYRYGFNGMESDDEVSGEGNSYTAPFWQYDSRVARRWNIDPVVKHNESPYATFANNPIWFVDPSGADTLDFNENGDITRHIDSETDVFRVFNKEGGLKDSKSFDKKVLQYKWEYKKDAKGKDADIDVLQLKGNQNGKEVFEFLADNTNVEWGFTATKRGSSQNAFITTSHDEDSESGGNRLLTSKLLVGNYKIIQHSHNHPNNTASPSGYGNNPDGFESDGNWGDRGFAKWLNYKYESKNGDDGNRVRYNIYLPKRKTYIYYDEDGAY